MNEKLLKHFNCAVYFCVFVLCGSLNVYANPLKVMITPDRGELKIRHNGSPVVIRRNQNLKNRITSEFMLTSRACPPHCLQPIKLKGIETVGEIEVLDYLQRRADGDNTVLVVDTRSESHVAKGTIPGSVNIFGDLLIEERGANPITIEVIFTEQFGVEYQKGRVNFSKAKTLVLYCYGIWCGQGPKTVNALVSLGYPKNKLKWYRGGMQAWESVGLTVVKE